MRNVTKNVMREALADMFGILEYKVRSGEVCYDDLSVVMSVIEANGGVKATVNELASFYHQSEDNVRHIIHRSFMPKPTRRVYYDMLSFAKNVPNKWHPKDCSPTD